MAFTLLSMLAKLTVDKSDYDKGMSEAGVSARDVGKKISTGLKVATAAGAAALAAFAKESVQTGLTFDASMSQVAATMGTTVDQIGELRAFAQKMGSETAFSASQAADAMNILAMAGYNAEQQIATLPAVLNMAAAGGLGIAEAADYATGIIAGFSNETLDAATIADKLAVIASSAKGDVASFGEGLSTVAGMANTTGQSMQDMTVALGILGNNNVAASEAGNALSRTLKNLYQATDPAKKQLAELGVSAYTAQGEARPLREVLLDLNGALDGMTDAKKNAILSNIFDAATLKTVPALLNNATDSWESLDKALTESSGAAAEMAGTQLDNLQGDITILKSAIEGLQISFSDKLTPALREGTQAFTGIVSGIKSMLDGDADFFSVGIDMMNKIGEGFVEGIPQFLSNALPRILDMSVNLRENAGSFVDAGIDFILKLGQGLINGLPTLIEYVPQIITNIMGLINDNAPKLLGAGLQLIVMLAQGIWNALPTVLANIGNIIQAIVSIISAFNWLDLGTKIISGIVNGLKSIGANIPNTLSGFLKDAVNAVKNIDWGALGKSIIDGIIGGIKAIGSGIGNVITGVVSGGMEMVRNAFKINSPSRVFSDQVGQWIPKGIAEGITKNEDAIYEAMSNLPSVAMNGYTDYDSNSQVATSNGNNSMARVISLLEQIAENGSSITIEGDPKGMFKAVRKEDRKFKRSTGAGAFAY